ncbi:MAG: hypothetical protein COR54_20035 [Elusimicrobia bacterium CG22_combo_CG10-13_8_21_14_all_63_91]|nr:MAG: hypothetical protein COR54_20035 [Elusimicrobia bacterium CG22_combo_CG10-13_8_21_14_all_63_91]
MSRLRLQGQMSLLAMLLSNAPVGAAVIGSSARHLEQGSWRASVQYQGVQKEDLEFDVGSSGTCAGNTVPAGTVTFPCGATGTVEATGSGESVIAKLELQPYERMQYYVSGGAGNYRLKASTLTAAGDNLGFILGGGVKALVMSESLVTPAIAIDAGVSLESYRFSRSNSARASIAERLELLRTYVAVEGSKRFDFDENITLEPYGGVKWLRTRATIKDLNSTDRQSGNQDTVSPFVGLSLPVFGREGFFAEASFVNGIHYGFGLNIAFGGKEKKA